MSLLELERWLWGLLPLADGQRLYCLAMWASPWQPVPLLQKQELWRWKLSVSNKLTLDVTCCHFYHMPSLHRLILAQFRVGELYNTQVCKESLLEVICWPLEASCEGCTLCQLDSKFCHQLSNLCLSVFNLFYNVAMLLAYVLKVLLNIHHISDSGILFWRSFQSLM